METGNQGGPMTPYSINRSNWAEAAKTYMARHGGEGFVIALKDGEHKGVQFKASTVQWGAWRAYMKARGIGTTFMDQKAQLTFTDNTLVNAHCWTVPAEWPHEFDAEATVQGDYRAGEQFARGFRPERPDMAAKVQREATVLAFKRRMPFKAKPETYEVAEEKPGTLIDFDKLLRDSEADMAAHAARKKGDPPTSHA